MSIDLHRHSMGISMLVPNEHKKAFEELVQRGANLWPDAPAVIKRFADEVTEGCVQQNYKDTRPTLFLWRHRCSCGHVTAFSLATADRPTWSARCEGVFAVPVIVDTSEGKMEVIKTVPCTRVESFNPV